MKKPIRFKQLRNKITSFILDRQIKQGKQHRGRAILDPIPISLREEMRLRYATFKRALEFLFTPTRTVKEGHGTAFSGEVFPTGRLWATKISKDGQREDVGLISTKQVTDAGVAFIVDAFQGSADLTTMKFHGSGTSATGEAAGETTLENEVATRATGTTTEGASANIYRSVGTIAYTATLAIVEHGLFSASSGGTMLDRSEFSAINVVNGDSIEFTYELTFPSGN